MIHRRAQRVDEYSSASVEKILGSLLSLVTIGGGGGGGGRRRCKKGLCAQLLYAAGITCVFRFHNVPEIKETFNEFERGTVNLGLYHGKACANHVNEKILCTGRYGFRVATVFHVGDTNAQIVNTHKCGQKWTILSKTRYL